MAGTALTWIALLTLSILIDNNVVEVDDIIIVAITLLTAFVSYIEIVNQLSNTNN